MGRTLRGDGVKCLEAVKREYKVRSMSNQCADLDEEPFYKVTMAFSR